jgi:subtilisin family serine protease
MPWQDLDTWDSALDASPEVTFTNLEDGFGYRPRQIVVPAPIWETPRNADEETVRGQLADAGATLIGGGSDRAGRKGDAAARLELRLVEVSEGVEVASIIDDARQSRRVGIAYNHVVVANPQRHGGCSPPIPTNRRPSPVTEPQEAGAGKTIVVLDTGSPMPPQVANAIVRQADIEPPLASPATEEEPLAVGHGTMVADVVARNAPGAAIHIRRVLETPLGVADELDIALALDELPDDVDIVNASFGGRAAAADAMIALAAAVQRAQQRGMLIVASAGNEGESEAHFSAAFADVVGVAAARQESEWEVQCFSNRGEWVRVCAVGEDVETLNERGQAVLCSGTSFAAPLVAARIAVKAAADGTSAAVAAQALADDAGQPLVPDAGRLVV